ncbi:MAG: hypothetical protein ACI92G_001713 [Candidatus Pelagisphaera sp.]|jgi:hypothetical protein
MKNRNYFLSLSLALAMGATIVSAAPPAGKGPGSGGGGGGGGGDSGSTYVDPQVKQTGLVQMGTSGGWQYDLANGYCCGGTLGALVTDLVPVSGITNTYILSNYHVLVADIFDGSNGIATIGDPVVQPALIDTGCDASGSNDVGSLAAGAIPFFNKSSSDALDIPIDDGPSGLAYYYDANVDAGLALINDNVDDTGAILNIGTISSNTVEADIDMRVKKMGRTTGLSSSRISGLNATINIRYENECAGESVGVATFRGQIVIENKRSKFLAGGDSGSLMVEDVDDNPRAVGLLFAGSSRTAIANPIDDVLNVFGMKMVGPVGDGTHEGVSATSASSSSRGSAQSEIAKAKAAQKKAGSMIIKGRGIVGHAVSLNAGGQGVVKVYVESLSDYDRSSVPAFIDGVRVEVEETGKIVAF